MTANLSIEQDLKTLLVDFLNKDRDCSNCKIPKGIIISPEDCVTCLTKDCMNILANYNTHSDRQE